MDEEQKGIVEAFAAMRDAIYDWQNAEAVLGNEQVYNALCALNLLLTKGIKAEQEKDV